MQRLPDLKEVREHVKESLRTIRPDIKRNLNPTPYKVSIVLIIMCHLINLTNLVNNLTNYLFIHKNRFL